MIIPTEPAYLTVFVSASKILMYYAYIIRNGKKRAKKGERSMEGSQNKQVAAVTGNKTKEQLRQFMNKGFSSIFEEEYLQWYIDSIYKYVDDIGYTNGIFEHGMAVVECMKREFFSSDYSKNEIGLVGPKGGFTTTVKGDMVGKYTIDIMDAAYMAINNSNNKVISKLKECFMDNEEAEAEIINLEDLLKKVLRECTILRQGRALFYKLYKPLDVLQAAWEHTQGKSSGICKWINHGYSYPSWENSVRKYYPYVKDVKSGAWESSKDNLFDAYEFIGYMLQGYIWKVINATVAYFHSKAAN